MCGYTEFGSFVHLLGPYLYLKRLTVVSYKGCMQGLVHIGLRHSDIVLKSSRYRFIQLMNHTESRITVYQGVHYNPYSKKIVYLLKVFILINHLLIYGKKVFYSSADLCLYTGFFKVLLYMHDYVTHKLLSLLFFKGNFLKQIFIYLGFKIL